MNELVARLSSGPSPVEANHPDKSAKALEERIELGYVHILFQNTGTELGIRLDRKSCDLRNADFEKGKGKIHLEGAITLNYDRVRCIADINLEDMQGEGYLETIDDENYEKIINEKSMA